MNNRQVALVLGGLAVLVAGLVLGLMPVSMPRSLDYPSELSPLLAPGDVLDERPGRLILSVILLWLGALVAIWGYEAARESE